MSVHNDKITDNAVTDIGHHAIPDTSAILLVVAF